MKANLNINIDNFFFRVILFLIFVKLIFSYLLIELSYFQRHLIPNVEKYNFLAIPGNFSTQIEFVLLPLLIIFILRNFKYSGKLSIIFKLSLVMYEINIATGILNGISFSNKVTISSTNVSDFSYGATTFCINDTPHAATLDNFSEIALEAVGSSNVKEELSTAPVALGTKLAPHSAPEIEEMRHHHSSDSQSSVERAMQLSPISGPSCQETTALLPQSSSKATAFTGDATHFASMWPSSVDPAVIYVTHKLWWTQGEHVRALRGVELLLETRLKNVKNVDLSGGVSSKFADMVTLKVKCLLKCADWKRVLHKENLPEVLHMVQRARDLSPNHHRVWHAWAVTNYDQLQMTDTNGSSPGGAGGDDTSSTSKDRFTTSFLPVVKVDAHGRDFTTDKGAHDRPPFKRRDMRSVKRQGRGASLANLAREQTDATTRYIVEAIRGFIRSINLGADQPMAVLLQDILRLMTLWFTYGSKSLVFQVLEAELDSIPPEIWLEVVPQLIARIHIHAQRISSLLKRLLTRVAVEHPQALVWPVAVAVNTNDDYQRKVAMEVLDKMRLQDAKLVEEARVISKELMRVAITPHEMWHEGLEQAAALYKVDIDLDGMLTKLYELHSSMDASQNVEEKPGSAANRTTLRDLSFRQTYGRDLEDARAWLDDFARTRSLLSLHQAWDKYHLCFRTISKQLKTLKRLELGHVSPELSWANALSVAIPGTYRPTQETVCIQQVWTMVEVISSKQRPRRMTMVGSDGKLYRFLLKGHEDLRQDERVMQLFGLINVCLENDRSAKTRGLSIVRYSVLPLSNNSGLIGWVENCDTISQLIKQYRESKGILLNVEQHLVDTKAPDYAQLPLMNKVEIFLSVMDDTAGQDVAKILWLKSKTAEVWIERRTNYTRSLAVMSMVGYILGLGDRHLANLMLDRVSGRVVHIDFGDCFEVSLQRAKYPETVPFRLTRMLINAMESSHTQGTFQSTSEKVMRVLRYNGDSVMAMLEAFVYDPLISWKLLTTHKTVGETEEQPSVAPKKLQEPSILKGDDVTGNDNGSPALVPGIDLVLSESATNKSSLPHSLRMITGRGNPVIGASSINVAEGDNADDDPLEDLNARALEVINRIQAKLTGRDFAEGYTTDSGIVDGADGYPHRNLKTRPQTIVAEDLTVELQVERLIAEATSVENLCQLYPGWCPYW